MRKKPSIFTIGHSTRSIDEFVKLLQIYDITEVIDVRSIPKSRHNPQFSAEVLKQSLKRARIRYNHLKKLGGLRHAKKDSLNLGWHNASFRGFADYMATQEFSEGLEALMKIATSRETAIMCAEAVPWRCHRSLIADALVVHAVRVTHLLAPGERMEHVLTAGASLEGGLLTYP